MYQSSGYTAKRYFHCNLVQHFQYWHQRANTERLTVFRTKYKQSELNLEQLYSTLRAVGFFYGQTREKPLRATVCFSIEHARARHAPRDAFDAKVHLSIIFSLEVFRYKRIKMYLTQSAKERFNSHCIFAIILRKWLRCFNGKKTLFLHDFYVWRPSIRLSTRMAQKSQQSASKVASIGSLCV